MFNVNVYPNPFTNTFHVDVISPSDAPIQMRIFDVAGKLLQDKKGIDYGSEIELGANLAKGVYLVEVLQQNEKKTIKLIKAE